MRTTLTLDDDVLEAARYLARTEGKAIGAVVSELARRGLAPRREAEEEQGFPVFSVPSGATPLTPEMVARALEDAG
jgi:hypothetical protein